MHEIINWGILGAGNIAHRFAESLKHDENSRLYAIAARNPDKAKAFVQNNPADKIYLDYEEMLQDDEIDAIYLALPHGLHYEWTIRSLNHHKPVLCEKPAMLNAKQMEEVKECALKNQCLFMEAMKPRFVPVYPLLKEKAKEMGLITKVEASLCNDMLSYIAGTGSYHMQSSQGGCLLDGGIYCATYLEDFLEGDISLDLLRGDVYNGVDVYLNAGLMIGESPATLECAFDRGRERKAVLYFENGKIEIPELHRPEKIIVCKDNHEEELVMPYVYDDFYGEIVHFETCLRQGLLQSDVMSLDDSIRCAKILDTIRSGMIYDQNDQDILIEQETILQYESFSCNDALELGNRIIKNQKRYDREIAVSIIRESDGLTMFQFAMDSKNEKNIGYMAAKRNAVLKTGHSSLYSAITKKNDDDKDCLNSAGAFPIYVNHQHVATVMVSGLHEGLDHELIIRSLSEVLDKDVPEFRKLML